MFRISIEIEKSLKKLQNTQRSHKPAKKATKEEDQIAKNILPFSLGKFA
jgi:hypothetical protein